MTPWFEAQHDGDCEGGCGGEIRAGDTIRKDAAGDVLDMLCGADE